MKRFTNILMAYDGSNISGDALEVAKQIAQHQSAKLTVLYVHDSSMEESMWPMVEREGDPYLLQSQGNIIQAPWPVHMPEVIPHHEKERIQGNLSEAIIAGAKGRIIGDIDAHYETRHGKPAKEISKYADENEIDLIVMGSRGLSGVKKYTMGSVSHKISNTVDCSTFFVR